MVVVTDKLSNLAKKHKELGLESYEMSIIKKTGIGEFMASFSKKEKPAKKEIYDLEYM